MEDGTRTAGPDVTAELAALGPDLNQPPVHVAEQGSTALWDSRDRRREVCMVVRRPNGKLLTFTKTFYPPGAYRLLTGGVEPGEDVLEALRREVAQETGLEVDVRRSGVVPSSLIWICAA